MRDFVLETITEYVTSDKHRYFHRFARKESISLPIPTVGQRHRAIVVHIYGIGHRFTGVPTTRMSQVPPLTAVFTFTNKAGAVNASVAVAVDNVKSCHFVVAALTLESTVAFDALLDALPSLVVRTITFAVAMLLLAFITVISRMM
jgi:hypothetical protein